MNARTKATNIPQAVKVKVYQRDRQRCVMCGKWVEPRFACAHVIPRSKGGLGIEQNIVTLCMECHYKYDSTTDRKVIREMLVRHLRQFYPDWQEHDMIYTKGLVNDKPSC